MINTAEAGKGFWITVGVIVALLIASLIMGVFKKVA